MGRSKLLGRRRRRKAAEAEAEAEAAQEPEVQIEASDEDTAQVAPAEADMIAEGAPVEPPPVGDEGEADLETLLTGLAPVLDPEIYVYVQLPKADEFIGLFPLMLFNEAEGVTGIVPLSKAEAASVDYQFECRRITLTVHSALHAVGLISTVSEALEDAEIPCNVVSAFHHDHIFVPAGREDDALAAINQLNS